MRFVHTADLHLGLRFKQARFSPALCEKRRLELWETLRRIVAYCNDSMADALFVAGDLYESEYFTLDDFRALAEIFNSLKGTEVFIVSGNHDYHRMDTESALAAFGERVHFFAPGISRSIEKEGYIVHGFSWDTDVMKEPPSLDFRSTPDKLEILLLHADVGEKVSDYLPISLSELQKFGFDYVALGHIHQFRRLAENIIYCGSPEPLNFGEEGVHGIVEGVIEKGKCSCRLIPFAKRAYVKSIFTLTEEMNRESVLQAVLNAVGEERHRSFFRLRFSGLLSPEVDWEGLKSALSESFFYVEFEEAFEYAWDLKLLLSRYEGTVVERFIRSFGDLSEMDELHRRALQAGLLALISRGAP